MEPGAELVEQLTDELERLCRRARPVDIRAVDTPTLDEVANVAGTTAGELVAWAVQQVEPLAYREAAHRLLTDDAVRSQTFTVRSKLAAEAFGISYDGFRRAGDGRPSARTSVLTEVARHAAHRGQDTSGEQADPVGPDELVTIDNEPRTPGILVAAHTAQRRRRTVAVAAAAIGLLAAAIAIPVLTRSDRPRAEAADSLPSADSSGPRLAAPSTQVPPTVDGPSTSLYGSIDVSSFCTQRYGEGSIAQADPGSDASGWRCFGSDGSKPVDLDEVCRTQYGQSAVATSIASGPGNWRCVVEVGGPADADTCAVEPGSFDSSLTDEFSTYAADFRQLYELHGGQATLGCPLNLMHHWAGGVMQELGTDGTPSASLLALSPDQALLLEGAAWQAFDRIKGLTGGLVGYPVNEPVLEDEMVVIRLSAGGMLIAKKIEGPFYWLTPVVTDYWLKHGGRTGCLGPPASDAYTDLGTFKQAFERGQLTLDPFKGTLDADPGTGCSGP